MTTIFEKFPAGAIAPEGFGSAKSASSRSCARAAVPRQFDGIICIGGEDWWYHNRGHFDFQIMRRLARRYPVLFVNSLGVRMPSFKSGSLFAARIARKVKSLSRGVVHVENGFWVFSPIMAPGPTGQMLSDFALAPQIRLAARRAGIRKPLLWVHCPAGAKLMDEIDAAACVMQRTDRFEAFPEADPTVVARQIAHMKSRADLVVYAAPHLMREETGEVRAQVLVTHGVELQRFVAAGEAADRDRRACDPADIAHLAHPRVGFVGGMDHHTFDPELFVEVARRLEGVEFVMVGGSSLAEGWCPLPNVTFVGRKPYDEVASYMAACDCLVMPWNRSDWIRACNPVKLKEYLAVGRPIVTTDFAALDGWRHLVTVASGGQDFANAILESLARPIERAVQRASVAGESWDGKADLLAATFADMGLTFVGTPPRAD
ncbi:MAG: glycosyltransferase [Hyphomicrobiaceae bacterium]